MARLTAGLVWAAVLRFLVFGVGLSRGSEDLFHLFDLLHLLGPTPVKIFCKENPNLNVAIRDNAVVLAQAKPHDPSQEWTLYCSGKRDKAFALVNKATGEAMVNKDVKSSDNEVHVQLAPYDDDKAEEESMLWTLGDDLGGGYREVRTQRDGSQTLNGLFGGVHPGTFVGIYPSTEGDNAIWNITCAY